MYNGMLKKLKHELNYLTKDDITGVVFFLLSLIPSSFAHFIFKFQKKNIWIIAEDRNEARDNGICFFRYLNSIKPDAEVYYAISKKSPDFNTVAELGKTVEYGSIRHWILYLNSEFNISTQKAGKPSAAVGYVLEKFGFIRGKSIFLQHGITINKATWLFYKNTKMRLFVCGAMPEYEYVLKEFGYPDGYVAYLGFCRFDDYHKNLEKKNQILLIPSWREWIGSKNEFSNIYEDTSAFENTEYYQRYQSLINNTRLHELLKKHNIRLFFYPHRNMQQFADSFKTDCEYISIVNNGTSNIRELLIDSSLMITDYSSVALDFAYMKKPVIYYQFDVERFREAQYEKGYFDYNTCGLGSCFSDEHEVIFAIEESVRNNYSVNRSFDEAHKRFFPLFDNHNCERTYNKLREIRDEQHRIAGI